MERDLTAKDLYLIWETSDVQAYREFGALVRTVFHKADKLHGKATRVQCIDVAKQDTIVGTLCTQCIRFCNRVCKDHTGSMDGFGFRALLISRLVDMAGDREQAYATYGRG